jgi:hypothetical protein
MVLFENFIFSILDSFMVIIVINSLVRTLNIKKTETLAYILVTSTLLACIGELVENEIVLRISIILISMVMLLVYLYLQGSRNFATNILIYFASALLLLVIQLLVIIFFNIIFGNLEYNFKYGLFSQLFSFTLVVVLASILPLNKIYILIEKKVIFFEAIITFLFFIFYLINVLWDLDINNINDAIGIIIYIVLFTILITVTIVHDGMMNLLYKEKIKMYDTYLPIIDDIMDGFRKYQHDFHNHIQTIVAMNSSSKVSGDIEQYLKGIVVGNIWSDLIKIDNEVLMAFIYSKYMEAKSKGIIIHLNIDNYYLKSIYSTYELVELYGVLLDNALEATLKYEKNLNIDITMAYKHNKNIFEVRNPYSLITAGEIRNYFKSGFSTKNIKNHGVGLCKAKIMIERKNGSISFYYDTIDSRVVVRLEHY